jgi:hypothetical protein
VSDVAFGTANNQTGWNEETGNKKINPLPEGLPVSPVRFKPIKGNVAATKLPAALPEGYPTEDFYGNPIEGGKAAGAVQEITATEGWYIELSTNNSDMGNIASGATPDKDGIVDSLVGIQPGVEGEDYVLASWTMNGETFSGMDNQKMTTHTWATAVFGWKAEASADGLKSALTNNAKAGDVIVVSAGDTPIELESPLEITESVTIEGKGLVLKRSWSNSSQPLLNITNADAEVTIRGVQFTGSGQLGGAVENKGKLTLESCIFDGNYVSGDFAGGAINSSGDLTIRGCTFYNNKSVSGGGAVHFEGNNLILTGNLFYQANTISVPLVVYSGKTINASYNAVNKDFGTGGNQAGWSGGTGNTTITSAPFNTTTNPMTFVPNISGLDIVKAADFPATDFYGTVRKFFGDFRTAGAVTYEQ